MQTVWSIGSLHVIQMKFDGDRILIRPHIVATCAQNTCRVRCMEKPKIETHV